MFPTTAHPRAALVTALAVLATGCAASAAPQTDGAARPVAPTAEVRSLILPFDAYELSHRESFEVAEARDLLMRACMRKRGHDWQVLDYPAHVDDLKNRRRYGVIEKAVAREFGYHANARVMSAGTAITELRKKRDESLGPAGIRAAYDEKNGCGYQANDRLERDGALADYDRFNRLSSDLLKKTKKQPEAVAALNRWETCMRRRGFGYRTPDEAVSDTRWWSRESARASDEEIATASADVRCKQRARLVGVLFRVESALQRQAVADDRAYFSRLAEAKARHLEHAREVIDRR
ncbi:hypothetical protein ACPXCS_18820 [Streptomyces sp. DT190]|uniref:hypothetical protein n=1 Tax=unclassified Streptomyces TaxID=2593676 RepID=UPI003CED6030